MTSDVNQANVIAALNGPMAHVYVKGASGWGEANGDPVLLGKVTDKLYRVLVEGESKLTDNQKEKFIRLLSSIDKILVRTNGQYRIYKGVIKDAQNNITGLVAPGALSELEANNPDYINATKRIEGMNNPKRSGDLVLLMSSGSGDPPDDRYTSGVSCKSWHGSLNKSDSYVPWILAYPGGNKYEIDPVVNSVCLNGQCEGNWQLSDIVKKIIETQYSGH